jgi:hypothetical protein
MEIYLRKTEDATGSCCLKYLILHSIPFSSGTACLVLSVPVDLSFLLAAKVVTLLVNLPHNAWLFETRQHLNCHASVQHLQASHTTSHTLRRSTNATARTIWDSPVQCISEPPNPVSVEQVYYG